MNCKDCNELLDHGVFADLAADERREIETHAAGCPACAARLKEAVAYDRLLSGFFDSREAALAARRRRWAPWSWRVLAVAAALAISAFGGQFVGRSRGQADGRRQYASLFAQADASSMPPAEVLRSAAGLGFENGFMDLDFGRDSGFVPSPGNDPLFAELDSSVTHSGRPSLKIYQRSNSGDVVRHIGLPLPVGTEVKLIFWALLPKGGTNTNKWISASLRGDAADGGTAAGSAVELYDASPNWRPYILSLGIFKPSTGFDICFGTGGDGLYRGWDWAGWIDDAQVDLCLHPQEPIAWSGSGDVLRARLVLPAPYRAEDVDPASVRLIAYSHEYAPVSPVAHPSGFAKGVYRFESADAIKALRAGNPDLPGTPAVASIRGRVRYRGWQVPFMCSLVGSSPGP